MQQAETPTTTGGPPQHPPGTHLREYETLFLVRPDLAEDLVDKIVERMRGIVQRDGGKVIKVENWGKKKTAYEVKKHLRAIFIRFDYLGGTGAVAEFERNLRMTDDVLKYQSVKLAEAVDPATRRCRSASAVSPTASAPPSSAADATSWVTKASSPPRRSKESRR